MLERLFSQKIKQETEEEGSLKADHQIYFEAYPAHKKEDNVQNFKRQTKEIIFRRNNKNIYIYPSEEQEKICRECKPMAETVNKIARKSSEMFYENPEAREGYLKQNIGQVKGETSVTCYVDKNGKATISGAGKKIKIGSSAYGRTPSRMGEREKECGLRDEIQRAVDLSERKKRKSGLKGLLKKLLGH